MMRSCSNPSSELSKHQAGQGWEAVFVKVVGTLWDHTIDLQGNILVLRKFQQTVTDPWNIPGTPKYKYGRYGKISFINRWVEDLGYVPGGPLEFLR